MLKNIYKLKVKENLSFNFYSHSDYLLKNSITYLYENKHGNIRIVSSLGDDISISRDNFKFDFLNENGKLLELFEILEVKSLENKDVYDFIKSFKSELFVKRKSCKIVINNLESFISVTQHHWGGFYVRETYRTNNK